MTISQYRLRPATAYEIIWVHDLNAASWAGDLSVQIYHKRERLLASQPLCRNGGLSSWVLVDPAEDHKVLSSCETIKKDAFVSRPPIDGELKPEVETVVAHAIGSVFTPMEHRGQGYAGIMLQQLSDMLSRGNNHGFSVLYSDIGKKFYAKHGWIPHRSSHLEFPAMQSNAVADIRYLRASDVPTLCVKDTLALEDELAGPAPHTKTRIAFHPDYQTMEWHWTREEFVGPILKKGCKKPTIKGAISSDGKRWIIWNRDFGRKKSQLYIIRLVNLSKNGIANEEEEIAKLLRVAANEAKIWGLQKVTLWNPDEITVKAARRVAGKKAQVVDRETDSIPSLMMHDQGSEEEEVEWVSNEKYGWC
ncbi:hypothetical protein EDC01DRAFT_641664 [Geopyxis carbonaria]|nr:hypothetical protein EDC01DRAFT_641664 [Geopyxis carbonaria]